MRASGLGRLDLTLSSEASCVCNVEDAGERAGMSIEIASKSGGAASIA